MAAEKLLIPVGTVLERSKDPEAGFRVLIIDDQPESITLLVEFLRDSALEIMVAVCGRDGIEKAARGKADLVLLDVRMPGVDGFEVCRTLRADQRTSHIPVIFLTGCDDVADKLKAFSLGACDYVTKPFDEAEVKARVSLQLRNMQERRRLALLAGDWLLGSPTYKDPDEVLFQTAIALLGERVAEPPSVVELAGLLHSNEQRLTDLFRRKVGLSVHEYFQEMRLEAARRLMIDSSLQIQIVAFKVGYRNAGDFSRAFRRRYGIGPREFRKLGEGNF